MIFPALAPFSWFSVPSVIAWRAARVAGGAFAIALGCTGPIAGGAGSLPQERRPPVVNCVFLGNSLVEAGCDMPVFVSAWPKQAGVIVPLNLALGATTPEEHGLILKRVLELPVKLKYLIYGFVDDQLNAPVRGDWSELEGNRDLFFAREAVALQAPRPLPKWRHSGAAARAPLLTVRSSLWDEVELLRWSLEENAEAAEIASFNRRCETILARKSGFSSPVSAIIRLARKHGATVILVEMPMPARHRQVLYESPAWGRMHRYMQSLAWEEGAVFLTASDWMDDDQFVDVAHLNEAGARRFSARLAVTLSRLEAIAFDPVEVVSR